MSCKFAGRWEGNFSTERRGHDPFRKVEFRGNDFRELDGPIQFLDVAEHQLFDEGGKHIVLRPGGKTGPPCGISPTSIPRERRSDPDLWSVSASAMVPTRRGGHLG